MKVILFHATAFDAAAFIRDEKSVGIIRVIAIGILAAEMESELTTIRHRRPMSVGENGGNIKL